ncbi:AsnC family transcriptional regulator, partial [Streptomyces sp. NPDC051987]
SLRVGLPPPLFGGWVLPRRRSRAGVSTRTTVVLSTPYEARPPKI